MLTGSVGSFVAGFGVATVVSMGVRELVSLGKEAVQSAGRLSDMSAKTGLSAEMLQRLEFVAGQAGGTLEDFTNASFRLGVRLSSGGSSVNKAVEQLGLNLASIKKESPERQLMLVVDALGKVENEQERNRIGVELFGKSYANIASAVAQHMSDIAKNAKVMTNAQVAALDELGDKWDKWIADRKASVKGFFGEIAMGLSNAARIQALQAQLAIVSGTDPHAQQAAKGTLKDANGKSITYLQYLEEQVRQLNARDQARSGTAGDLAMRAAANEPSAVQQLKDMDAQLRKLTDSQRAEIEAMLALGKAHEEIEDKYGLTEGAISRFTATQREATKAQKENEKTTRDQAAALEAFQDDFRNLRNKFESLPIIPDVTGLSDFEGKVPDASGSITGRDYIAELRASYEELEGAVVDVSDVMNLVPWGTNGDVGRSTYDLINLNLRLHDAVLDVGEAGKLGTFEWREGLALTAASLHVLADATDGTFSKVAGLLGMTAQSFTAKPMALEGLQMLSAGNSEANGRATPTARIMGGMQLAAGFANLAGVGPRLNAAISTGDSRGGRAARGAAEMAQATQGFGPQIQAVAALGGAVAGMASDPAVQGRHSANAFLTELSLRFDDVATSAEKAEAETASFQARIHGGHAEQFTKAWLMVSRVYEETGQTQKRAKKDFEELIEAAKKGPDAVARAMQAINAQSERYSQLLDARKQKQAMLTAAVERWGLATEEAGEVFQRLDMAKQSEQMIEDFQLLTESGASPATVAGHMAEAMNKLVSQARATGTEIPEALKPIAQSLIDQHMLLDDSGRAFTSLKDTGLNFGKTLETMFEGVLRKLDELITKLTTPLPDVPTRGPSPLGVYTGDTAVARKHRGGMIYAHDGLFVGGGSMFGLKRDEVPIIAQTGEAVMSRFATRMMGGPAAVNALNSGQPWQMPRMADPMAGVWEAAQSVSRPTSSPVPYRPIDTQNFREGGGSFTAQFGDIHIVVTGEQKNPREIAAEVIRQLPRALKHNDHQLQTTMIRTVRGRV